jgi:hypothetical protein
LIISRTELLQTFDHGDSVGLGDRPFPMAQRESRSRRRRRGAFGRHHVVGERRGRGSRVRGANAARVATSGARGGGEGTPVRRREARAEMEMEMEMEREKALVGMGTGGAALCYHCCCVTRETKP